VFAVDHSTVDDLIVVDGCSLRECVFGGVNVFPEELKGVAAEYLFEGTKVFRRNGFVIGGVSVNAKLKVGPMAFLWCLVLLMEGLGSLRIRFFGGRREQDARPGTFGVLGGVPSPFIPPFGGLGMVKWFVPDWFLPVSVGFTVLAGACGATFEPL